MLDTQILRLPVEAIAPNPYQPRTDFAPEPLAELADSIRRHGILQPLTVRRTKTGWELVDTVPCLQIRAEDQESALLALIENIQRKDLHYFEEAAAIAAYLRQSGVTQEEAAALLGRSPSALANKLRLLRLSPDCRKLLVENGLSERHARALLRLDDPEERLSALRHIIRAGLNVAQAEQYVGRRLEALQATPPAGRRTFILKDVRLFLNSLDRSLTLMRSAGVDAACGRQDTEDEILLTIRIPKGRRVG